MAHIPRHEEIRNVVRRLRFITVHELTERLKVSDVTMSMDLTSLEEAGSIVHTRGGTQLAGDRPWPRTIQVRCKASLAEKKRIDGKAWGFVIEGDTIDVDSGSTCTLFARTRVDIESRVVTQSLEVMAVLAGAPGISLISVGGSCHRETRSFIGTTSLFAWGLFSSKDIVEMQSLTAIGPEGVVAREQRRTQRGCQWNGLHVRFRRGGSQGSTRKASMR